jgi:predicted metal-dependent hydrolase
MSRPSKKNPADIQRNPLKELGMSAEDWQQLEHGVHLFNGGKFWNAHEAWEQIWLRHEEDERLFFQGIIQLAAAYLHLVMKKSLRGMVNNFDKAYAKLEVFQPSYLGISVIPLLRCIELGKAEAEELGEENIADFNYNLIPKLQYHKQYSPDLLVEVREILRSEKFREGLELFNKGYHWEAHEAWEDVWRENEGEAKLFTQAFVQIAAGNSFLKQSKRDSAKYLFEKALEKLRIFEHLECGFPFEPLVATLGHVLEHELGDTGNGHNGDKPYGVKSIAVTSPEV